MTPLFSIITVCYNSADNLERTIASVDSQTYGSYEHIIVDGASSDRTSKVLADSEKDNRIILSEPDKGVYDAMNKGIGLASGEYFIFLNAGDRFHAADTLQIYADSINANDKPGIVYGQTILVDENNNYIAPRHLKAPRKLSYSSFSRGMLVCHQSMAVLKRIAPLYNTKYKFSADYEWSLRCLQHSRKNVYTGMIMCNYLSEGLTTANRKASLKERFRIMCYYYGTIPTIIRHAMFMFRFITQNIKRH